MGFLDLFKSNNDKSNNSVVWRDASGKIACPGDRCPKTCDESCPIYLNTLAMKHMMSGLYVNVIPLYKKAVMLAPDFYDAWNNMAAIYGSSEDYENAYNCYLKANKCAPNNPQPVFGLALAARDLERFDECIKWCNRYKELTNDNKADSIRNQAIQALNQASKENKRETPERTAAEPEIVLEHLVLPELINHDLEKGQLSKERVPVGELAENAARITHEIFNYVKDYFINEVKERKLRESKLSYNIYHTTLLWSALAGIGAMALWHQDREKLLNKGIVKSLTEERGFFAMDEFVLDKVTEGFGCDEANDLITRLELHIQPMLFKLLTAFSADGVDETLRNHQFINYCMALFKYGLVLQEDRLRIEEKSPEKKDNIEDDEPISDEAEESEMSEEERCGRAWLQIVGQDERDKGLATMRALGDEGFDEGYLALAMFTENQNGRRALLKMAADAGNTEAKWQYTGFLQHSYAANLGNANDTEWLRYCTEAAEGGCADAMNELGNVFNRQNNYAESMYWYAMANYYGHNAGQVSMAGVAGKWKEAGMPRRHIKGTDRFDDSRFTTAMTFLELYAGVAPTHDVNDMFKLALNGTALAAYFAGDIYEDQGMFEMAYRAYNAISFEYDPHGIKCYSDLLMTGRGTKRRPDDAFRSYKLAAEAGDRESMFTMGEYNRNNGNNTIAAYWYGKAYARGYEPAEARLLQMV